jgi:hypothetical protein
MGRVLCIKKALLKKIGYYPEYLTYAGEDTFFLYKYKKASKYWIFNKAAFLLWEHPPTIQSYDKEKIKLRKSKIRNRIMGLFLL